VIATLIKLLDLLNGILGQLTYFEGQAKVKDTPEAKYESDKAKMDQALASNDCGSATVLINDVLPPPQGGGDSK
jgi:hypothetical protein